MKFITNLFPSRAEKKAEAAAARTVKSEPADAFAHPSTFWQIHHEPDGSGGVVVSYHVRDDIVERALKKIKPIL